MQQGSKLNPNQQGSVLILALLVLATLFILGTAALNISSADDRITQVQLQRQQAHLAAEAAVDEAITQLYEKLQGDINYDPTGESDMTQQLATWSNLYQYTLRKSTESGFYYDILVQPAQPGRDQVGQLLAVKVKATVVPTGSTVITPEPPQAFQQAIFSIGNLKLSGNAQVEGPVYVQADPVTGEAGDLSAQGSAYICGGPVAAMGDITFQQPWNKEMGLTTLAASTALPIPIVNMESIQEQADYYFVANQAINVTQLRDGAVVYVEGSITKLYGDLGSKNLLLYATQDINVNSGLTQNFDGAVAVLAGNKVQLAGQVTLRGIIYAGGGIKVTGSQSRDGAKLTGAVVCNGGGTALGDAQIAYDSTIVAQLFSQWPLAGECAGEPLYQVKSVDVIRWEELN